MTKRIVKQVRDRDHTLTILKDLSIKYGGAWSYHVMPFSHEAHFTQYASPSRVPDDLYELSHNQIAYKGKLVTFTMAAQAREHQRGYSADR